MSAQINTKIDITVPLVTNLIAKQFPQWAHLPINPVEVGGHDNRTFHLGKEMLIRLPSAAPYALKVQKEQEWLPFLAPHLSVAIPQPIAMGNPSKQYPYHWSIYRWIDGKSVNTLRTDEIDFPALAISLAQFLNELHKIDTTGGPVAGPHNFYRGGNLAIYDAETRSDLAQLQGLIDTDTALVVWEKAISSQWDKEPVWVHGDLSAGNILIKDNCLVAVIDFGGMGIGDPACDLVIAWTLLNNVSRQIFKQHVRLDSNIWARARGWALWKALITLASLKDMASPEAIANQQIINVILDEQESRDHN